MASRKKSILVLTATFPRWRGDNEPGFIHELCRRLTPFYNVHVLAPHFMGAETFERLDNIRVTRFRYFLPGFETLAYNGGIPANLKKNPLNLLLLPLLFFFELLSIVRMLNRYSFDLIHAHWIFPQGLIAALLKSFFPHTPPILLTSHGSDLFSLRGRLFDSLRRFSFSRASLATVVSTHMRETLIKNGIEREKLYVIPMGVDLDRFTPSTAPPEHRETILYAGRLVEGKGVMYLIDAMPSILKRHSAVLKIAGYGPLREALELRVKELGIKNRISFLGAVKNSDLAGLYQESAITVFPSSETEGLGLVPVEALGCSCALVVSDTPSMKDIIVNNKSGIIVPVKSSEAIAGAVNFLLDNPEKAKAMGMEGRVHVLQKFSWNHIADKYADIISRAL